MRKLSFNKKGVSPVIATVLMILIVMAGMTILFAFVGNYSESFQSGRGSSVKESLTVEEAWFENSNKLIVWEYNTGQIDLMITSVYVDGSAVSFDPKPLSILQGGHACITITLNAPFDAGHSYGLKVVTQRGSGFEGVYTPAS